MHLLPHCKLVLLKLLLNFLSSALEDGATPCMQALHTKCFTVWYTHCSWLKMSSPRSPESRDCTSSCMCILVSIMIPTIPYYGEDLIVLSLLPACKCFTACCTHCSWLMMGSPQNYCTTSSPLQTKLNLGNIHAPTQPPISFSSMQAQTQNHEHW